MEMDQTTPNLPPIPRPPPPFSSSSRNANLTGASSPTQPPPLHGGSVMTRIDSFSSQPRSPDLSSLPASHQRSASFTGNILQSQSSNSLQPSSSGNDLQIEEPTVPFADDKTPNPTAEDLEKWARFRKNITTEILSTEVTYVKSLKQMFEVYHDPYQRGERNTGMSVKKIETLFKIVRIILNVAESFLQSLQPLVEKWDENEEIASIFLQYHPMFKTYKDFAAAHHQKILPVLNRLSEKNNFLTYQDKVLKTIPGCLDLASYLIMPIQRLPRYKLLLESLISFTPRSHPEAQNLVKALKHVSTVATAVNDAMREAQNVQHYIEIQTMFQVNDLVHLWRKLVYEVDAKISRIWLPTSPREDKKSDKEKREKRHRFVGLDCRIYIFTDCLFIGVKTKEREAHYEKARLNKTIYPIYGDGHAFKFSLLTLFSHDIQQNATVQEYAYQNCIVLGGPLQSIALNFQDDTTKTQCLQQLLSTSAAFEELSRKRTMSSNDGGAYRDPIASQVLCCDRCLHGLFELKTMGNMKMFVPHHEHFLCGQCNHLNCTKCLDDSHNLPATASRAHSRLGNRLHIGHGYGVLANPTSAPRICKSCSPAPSPRARGISPSRKSTVSKSISGFTAGGSGSRLSGGFPAHNHGDINTHTGTMLGMSLSDLQSVRLHSVTGGSNTTSNSSRHINTVFEGTTADSDPTPCPPDDDDSYQPLQSDISNVSNISASSTTLQLPSLSAGGTSIPPPPLTTPAAAISSTSSASTPQPPPFSPPPYQPSKVVTASPSPASAVVPPPFPAQLSNPSLSIVPPPPSSSIPPPPIESPIASVPPQPPSESLPPVPPSFQPSLSTQSRTPPPVARPMSCGSTGTPVTRPPPLTTMPSSPPIPSSTRSANETLERRLPLVKPSLDDDVPPPPPPESPLAAIPEVPSPAITPPASASMTTPHTTAAGAVPSAHMVSPPNSTKSAFRAPITQPKLHSIDPKTPE